MKEKKDSLIEGAKKQDRQLLEFFNVNRFPFISTPLFPPYDQLFVDRDRQLKYLKGYIRTGQNCAIVGGEGIGKSSFLYRLKTSMEDEIYSAYLQFALKPEDGDVRINFLRTILRELILIIGEDEYLREHTKVDLLFELNRLEFSITLEHYQKISSGTKTGIEAGIGGKLSELLLPVSFRAKLERTHGKDEGTKTQREFPIHTEETLKETIGKLAKATPAPIVLFIDELDKAGRYPLEDPKWDKEVIRLLELSREIMVYSKLIFVFALQEELQLKLKKARLGEENISLLGLIPGYESLERFDILITTEAVNKALKTAGFKGEIDALFEPGVLGLILTISKGNPRLIMNYLTGVMITASIEEAKPISCELLHNTIAKELGDIFTPERWDILTTLISDKSLTGKRDEEIEYLCERGYIAKSSDDPKRFKLLL